MTSILHVGILVSSGIPHEILFTASCSDVALLDIVVLSLRLPALSWAIRPDLHFPFQFAAVLSWDFSQVFQSCFGCCFLFWMSDSSSDTTHEAILHNVVSHQRRFAQQLQQLQTSVETLQQQLNFIQGQLQTLLISHGRPIQSAAPPSDCKKDQDHQ